MVANQQDFGYSLLYCSQPPEGYLKAMSTVDCYAIAQQCTTEIGDQTLTLDPKLACENYCDDLHSWQSHGCSYESHFVNITDKIMVNDNQWVTDNMTMDTMDMSGLSDSIGKNADHDTDILNKVTLSSEHMEDNSEHGKP